MDVDRKPQEKYSAINAAFIFLSLEYGSVQIYGCFEKF